MKVEPDVREDNEKPGRCSTSVGGDPSPDAGAEVELADLKLSPNDDTNVVKSETPSKSSTPVPRPKPAGPQLIGDLPIAREEALKTFVELTGNHYQYNTLGRSREAMEGMICDCVYDHGSDEPWIACGDGSDCINRLTQVECLPGECRCRSHCKNQRFRRKQYAPIEIVLTEKKGYGLRAEQSIKKDQFIYEYVGDVVSHPSFMKRMRDYANEGIRHFYFMMLQKDEYIDATKRGGIGRFANHSCNPNCYVAKWTVGEHVRMGIFASRNIKQYEELTFNYNVDRYGHDAQPCYCGEPNCVGILGGKTQTDLGGMDDLYLDALGITDEVEELGLKGSKKKKGKKLDEDYTPILKPLTVKDIPKLVQAMRQTQSRKVLLKLLTRIKMTDDQTPLRQLMRLRGFSVMKNILDDYSDDSEILVPALECMKHWPLLQRNKIEDSKVHVPIESLAQSEDETINSLAKALLEQWSTLESAYRIPKRLKAPGDDTGSPAPPQREPTPEYRQPKRPRMDEPFFESESKIKIVPLGTATPSNRDHFASPLVVSQKSKTRTSEAERRRTENKTVIPTQASTVVWLDYNRDREKEVDAIIEKVKADAERAAAEAAAAAAKAKEEEEARQARETARRERRNRPRHTPEEKEALKEKQLLKLVGAVVVKCMSKYKAQMDVELFKKHAKELTQIIADKEKRSSSYKEGKLDSLSEEKKAKIKKFAKDYIAKVLHKLQKKNKGQLPPPTDSANTSVAGASASTPDSDPEGDVDMDDPDDPDMVLAVSGMDGDDTPDTPVETQKASDPRMRVKTGSDTNWDSQKPVPSISVP